MNECLSAACAARVACASRAAREHSRSYDNVLNPWHWTAEMRDQALEFADLQSGHSAIDVGAGTGFTSVGVIGRVRELTMLDQSRAQLSKAAGKPQLDNATKLVGDAECLDTAVLYGNESVQVHINMQQQQQQQQLPTLLDGMRLHSGQQQQAVSATAAAAGAVVDDDGGAAAAAAARAEQERIHELAALAELQVRLPAVNALPLMQRLRRPLTVTFNSRSGCADH